MSENKFTTYLLYAVGEIVLVVVGILIAVSIDGWNQRSQNEEDTKSAFQSIAIDLRSDVVFLKPSLEELKWKNQVMINIQNGNYDKQDWITNDSIFASFISYPDFEVDMDNVSLLKSKNPVSSESKALSKEITDFYKKFSLEIAVRHRETDDATYSNLNYWRDHTDWYSYAFIERDYSGLADYAIGNPIFRNRLIHKRIMQVRLMMKLQEYLEQAEILIVKIEQN